MKNNKIKKKEEKSVQDANGKKWMIDLTKQNVMVIPKIPIKDHGGSYLLHLETTSYKFPIYLEICSPLK